MRTVKRLVVSMGTHRRSFPSPSANRGGGTPIHVFRRLFKCPRSSIRYIKRSSIVPESADGNVSTAGPSLSLSRYFYSQIRSIREEGRVARRENCQLVREEIYPGGEREGDFLDNSGKFSLVPGPINSRRLRQLVRGIIAVIIHGAICLEYRDREFQVCGSNSASTIAGARQFP